MINAGELNISCPGNNCVEDDQPIVLHLLDVIWEAVRINLAQSVGLRGRSWRLVVLPEKSKLVFNRNGNVPFEDSVVKVSRFQSALKAARKLQGPVQEGIEGRELGVVNVGELREKFELVLR